MLDTQRLVRRQVNPINLICGKGWVNQGNNFLKPWLRSIYIYISLHSTEREDLQAIDGSLSRIGFLQESRLFNWAYKITPPSTITKISGSLYYFARCAYGR
jgi:hypothetical protein